VEVRGIQAVPFDGNFDPEAVVGAAKNSGAEAFLVYAGESSGIRITSESAWQGYDPDLYLVGPGGSCDYFGLEAFGDPTNAALEGMVSLGAWNAGSAAHGAGAGEYSARFREYYTGKGMFWKDADGTYDPGGTVFQDWWGHICFYSALQVMQQAVEEAGELMDDGRINNLTLVDYIAKNSFDTAMHPRLRFNGNALTDDMYPGNIGQWQDGVFEVIDTDSRRTADPVYPKPSWHIEWPGE
jgi:ABC-type branched-subunit amino acid transport system substrate-binding protein